MLFCWIVRATAAAIPVSIDAIANVLGGRTDVNSGKATSAAPRIAVRIISQNDQLFQNRGTSFIRHLGQYPMPCRA